MKKRAFFSHSCNDFYFLFFETENENQPGFLSFVYPLLALIKKNTSNFNFNFWISKWKSNNHNYFFFNILFWTENPMTKTYTDHSAKGQNPILFVLVKYYFSFAVTQIAKSWNKLKTPLSNWSCANASQEHKLPEYAAIQNSF